LKELRNPSDLYRFLRESLKNQVENIQDAVKDLVNKVAGEEEADIDATVAEDTLD
jgi:hypothetical protein